MCVVRELDLRMRNAVDGRQFAVNTTFMRAFLVNGAARTGAADTDGGALVV